MLTRLEVQGFKNLLDVDIDFGPFTCIAGANGMGKSNIFDAIEFLSYLASDPLVEASQRVRGSSGTRGGDPRDLFWDGYGNHQHLIKLAAEMIVPSEVEDDLGTPAEASATFLRYEVSLGYKAPRGEHGPGRLNLVAEGLHQVPAPGTRLRFPHSAPFRKSVIHGERRTRKFLSTVRRGDDTLINLHEDDGRVGTTRPADRAGRTVLSTVNTNDYPTILAARREMQNWRRLALEPSALRAPDGVNGPQVLATDGRHLASSLFRIAHAPGDDFEVDPDRVYASVAGRLSDLAGVRIEGLDVEYDPAREVFTLFLQEQGGLRLPARALSEGTLRFLALCVLLEDPSFTGLICMEEPENGIHPANLPAMLELVRDLAVDPWEAPGDSNPFRQVIVNTHSPWVVQLCDPSDLLLADVKPRSSPSGRITRSLSLLPFIGTWRATPGRPTFSKADVVAYLAAPPGAQLRLPLDLME
jgi:predicted ATPase